MLSEFKKISDYPLLETPVTIRLGFYKKGALQYISHLDLQRTFQRILSRAELPLWYTQGFNPHPKLVFGLPLPIGCESVCENGGRRIAEKAASKAADCADTVPTVSFSAASAGSE